MSLGAATCALAAFPSIHTLAFAVGVLAAASLPDDCELPIKGDERMTIIPHRTWTHWPWPWAAIMFASALLAWPWSGLIGGAACGALLHLLIDALSPHGIPLLLPTRAIRNRFAVYTSRTMSEWRLVGPMTALAAAAVVLNYERLAALPANIVGFVLHAIPRF